MFQKQARSWFSDAVPITAPIALNMACCIRMKFMIHYSRVYFAEAIFV